MTDRPLTPESEALHKTYHYPSMQCPRETGGHPGSCGFYNSLAAIEAAAIARYVEGLGTQVSHRLHEWGRGPGCNGRNVTMVVCEGCQTFAARLLTLYAPEEVLA